MGGWKRKLRTHEVDIELMMLDVLSEAEERALAAAIEDYAAFIGRRPGRVERR